MYVMGRAKFLQVCQQCRLQHVRREAELHGALQDPSANLSQVLQLLSQVVNPSLQHQHPLQLLLQCRHFGQRHRRQLHGRIGRQTHLDIRDVLQLLRQQQKP